MDIDHRMKFSSRCTLIATIQHVLKTLLYNFQSVPAVLLLNSPLQVDSVSAASALPIQQQNGIPASGTLMLQVEGCGVKGAS